MIENGRHGEKKVSVTIPGEVYEFFAVFFIILGCFLGLISLILPSILVSHGYATQSVSITTFNLIWVQILFLYLHAKARP